MDLLNSIKKQRELFSKTLSTAKMPRDLAAMDPGEEGTDDIESESPFKVNLRSCNPPGTIDDKQRPSIESPRSKRTGVSDARQLVSSLRSKREDMIKRFEKAQLSSYKSSSFRGGDTGNISNEDRPKQKAVVDMSLLEGNNKAIDDERTDLSMRVKSFQDRIKSLDVTTSSSAESSVVAIPPEFRTASVSESLAKFEKRCPNNEESSERRAVSYEVKRSSMPLLQKQANQVECFHNSRTTHPQDDEPSSSTTSYPSRTACNPNQASEPAIAIKSHPPVPWATKGNQDYYPSRVAAYTEESESSNTSSTMLVKTYAPVPWGKRNGDDQNAITHARLRSPDESLSRQKDRKSNAAWIKKPDRVVAAEDEPNEWPLRKRNGTVDGSWIKNACEELCWEAETSAPMDTAWANHVDDDDCIERKMASAMALSEQTSSEDVSNDDEEDCTKKMQFASALRSADRASTRCSVPDYRRQSTLSSSVSVAIDGRQKFLAEPSWINRRDSRGQQRSASAKRKFGLQAPQERCEHTLKRHLATPGASWIKKDPEANTGDATSSEASEETPRQTGCSVRPSTTAAPSWVKPNLSPPQESRTSFTATPSWTKPHESPTPSWVKPRLSSPHGENPVATHTRRKSAGNMFSVGQAGPAPKGKHDGVSRRKSVGDFSWIRKNVAQKHAAVAETPETEAIRAPWIKSEPAQAEKPTQPASVFSTENKNSKSDQSETCQRRGQSTPRSQPLSSSPEVVPTSRDDPLDDDDSTGQLDEDFGNNDALGREPHNMALSDKVSMFESTNKDKKQCHPVTPRNSTALPAASPTAVKAVLESWKEADRSQDVFKPGTTPKNSPLVIRQSQAIPSPAVTAAGPTPEQLPMSPTHAKVTFKLQKPTPAKNTKISSLINKMEKFSLGGSFEASCEGSDQSEGADAGEEVDCESAYSDASEPRSRAITPVSSVDNSVILEYGDAGFSFADDEEQEAEEEANQGDDKSYLFEESEEASEGSTYKIDNYQKDFNEAIPIQSPWLHPPMPQLDNFAEFVSSDHKNAMTIVSIAPPTTLRAPSYDYDGYDTEPCYNDYQIRQQRPPLVRSLTTRRTYHQVARNSLLAATRPRRPRRSMSVDCIEIRDEPDPIFQVSDDMEQKSSKRKIKKFLSKPKDDEGSNSQEENKPTTKSMFKILKKGLVTSSSKRDEPEHHQMIADVADETTVADDEYYVRTDSRTTISSITRSVNSNPDGGSSSQRSSDSKPAMPLGVLNGFFKAARKLQKKSKRKSKSRRGRSMSNKPPLERRPINVEGDVVVDVEPIAIIPMMPPPTDVQLWPAANYQIPETPAAHTQQVVPTHHAPTAAAAATASAAAIGDRRFGTYGGLLYASSRSRALTEPIPQIQSLASW